MITPARCRARNDRRIAVRRERISQRPLVLGVYVHQFDIVAGAKNNPEGLSVGELLSEFGTAAESCALVALVHRPFIFPLNPDRESSQSHVRRTATAILKRCPRSWRLPPQQFPPCKHRECAVEPFGKAGVPAHFREP